MIKRHFSAAVLVAVLAIGAPVWAETPMSPLRRTDPPNPPAGGDAQQWIEPPAASKEARPSPSTAEDAAPGAGPERSARGVRPSRQVRRAARGRVWSTRELNRQQLYGGWSGASMPYYRGYGPAPYSASGD